MVTHLSSSIDPIDFLKQAYDVLKTAQPGKEVEVFQHFAFKGSAPSVPKWDQLQISHELQDMALTHKVTAALLGLVADAQIAVDAMQSGREKKACRKMLNEFNTRLHQFVVLEGTAEPVTQGTASVRPQGQVPDNPLEAVRVAKSVIKQPIGAPHAWVTKDPVTWTVSVLGAGGTLAGLLSGVVPNIAIIVAVLTVGAVGVIWAIEGVAFVVTKIKERLALSAFQRATLPDQFTRIFTKLSYEAQASLVVHLGSEFRRKVAHKYRSEKSVAMVCHNIDRYQQPHTSHEEREEILKELTTTGPLGEATCVALLNPMFVS
jgi:hypothetical protein